MRLYTDVKLTIVKSTIRCRIIVEKAAQKKWEWQYDKRHTKGESAQMDTYPDEVYQAATIQAA
jgi:hypothetical protein